MESPSPPFLIQPPPEEDVDLDPDQPLSRASSTTSSTNNNNWNDINDLLPASRNNSGLLSPDAASTFRRPPSRMSDYGPSEGAAVTAAQSASPFNFETQFMSASPVKSVSHSELPSPAHDFVHSMRRLD